VTGTRPTSSRARSRQGKNWMSTFVEHNGLANLLELLGDDL
jgi:hypothetical protein